MAEKDAAFQFFNDLPPRDGGCVALAATSTVAHQDMTALTLFKAFDKNKNDSVFVTMIADGCDIYVNFSAAGTTPALSTTETSQASGVPFLLPQGLPFSFRVIKLVDEVLSYITATGKTGTLRLYASSHISQSGVGSQ